MDYNVLKGTHDIIDEEAYNYSYIEEILTNIAWLYDFKEYRVPVIEKSELYQRSVGEGSDIVRKEMYTFEDKGNRLITLRPEFTAGIIRSMINSKFLVTRDLPLKAFYCGPVFRYERPQLGRYRQFNQFGIEIVGSNSYLRDVECIAFGYTALKMLGFKNLELRINTLGDKFSRENYKKALVNYFSKHINEMCNDCKERLKLNPLRILDCKVLDDQEIIKGAPLMKNYLTLDSKTRFENVLEALDIMGIPYIEDDTLVRGLDYYSETVFEFHYTSKNGNNYGAIGAGGHYSDLVKELGGPVLSGVGLSFGIERLYNILKDDNKLQKKDKIDLYIAPIGNVDINYIMSIVFDVRNNGYSCEINLESKSITSSIKKAVRANSKYLLIIGEDEMKDGIYTLKNLETQEQLDVYEPDLIKVLDALYKEEEDKYCDLTESINELKDEEDKEDEEEIEKE